MTQSYRNGRWSLNQLAHKERLTDARYNYPNRTVTFRHAICVTRWRTTRIVLNDGVKFLRDNDRPIPPPPAGESTGRTLRILSVLTERVSLRLSLPLAIIRKATATILRRSGGGEEAAKQSGYQNISASCQQQFTSDYRVSTVRAMSFFRLFRLHRHLPCRFRQGNENWRNSGWIFWESISVRRDAPSTVLPGTAAAGANRARWLNIRQC